MSQAVRVWMHPGRPKYGKQTDVDEPSGCYLLGRLDVFVSEEITQ